MVNFKTSIIVSEVAGDGYESGGACFSKPPRLRDNGINFMCMCWDFDENGKVVGLCSQEELKRRIHDPNYMPELKASRRKMIEDRHREVLRRLTPERRLEIAEELRNHFKRG